jgi:RNA polymerase sigma factor (sigma-70 family)
MYDGADDVSVTGAAFEQHRSHVRSVAYRMLGSVSDADDAVQEVWLRLGRSIAGEIANLRGWLTTVVGRVCLDMLRARTSRREDPLEVHVPDPIVTRADGAEAAAIRADAVGLALMVVLQTLEPDERLAFVLHDVCDMTFDEIAPILDRSAVATRQLASRARRRVQGEVPAADTDLRAQRRVVEAFLAAVKDGDVAALIGVLHPEIVLRADGGAAKGLSRVVRGAQEVAAQAQAFSTLGLTSHIVLVNGHIGVVSRLPNGRVLSVIGYTVAGGTVVAMDILADPDRIAGLDLSAVD